MVFRLCQLLPWHQHPPLHSMTLLSCVCFWRPNPRLVHALVRTPTWLYSRPFSAPSPSTICKDFFLFLSFPALRFWRNVFCSPVGTFDTSVLIRLGLCTGGQGDSLRNTKPVSRHPRRRQPVSACPVGTLITGQDGVCSFFFPHCKVAIFLFVKLRGQGYNSD